jgi:hypothetical protein
MESESGARQHFTEKSQLIWRFDGNLRGKQETCGQSKEERRDR